MDSNWNKNLHKKLNYKIQGNIFKEEGIFFPI